MTNDKKIRQKDDKIKRQKTRGNSHDTTEHDLTKKKDKRTNH